MPRDMDCFRPIHWCQKVFSKGKKELNLLLEPGESTTFRHRLLIRTGETTAKLIEDSDYRNDGATFINASLSDPMYHRIESSLMIAFEQMSKLEFPPVSHQPGLGEA